jgi:hypothetical protein
MPESAARLRSIVLRQPRLVRLRFALQLTLGSATYCTRCATWVELGESCACEVWG